VHVGPVSVEDPGYSYIQMMLAVVVNSSHHTYFLRENDQVFNGSVEKITSDSIIFREFVKDPLGRETAREVVKKLVPPS